MILGCLGGGGGGEKPNIDVGGKGWSLSFMKKKAMMRTLWYIGGNGFQVRGKKVNQNFKKIGVAKPRARLEVFNTKLN